MHLSNNSEREKLILYFYQLQKLDPIIKVFSDRAFRSYVCFPYVKCNNLSGKSWVVEVLVAEELFSFPYPFQLPKSFLNSANKHDLRLKVRLMKSLAVSERGKRLDVEFLFLMKSKDSYVFTSDRKPNQMLSRQTLTMEE